MESFEFSYCETGRSIKVNENGALLVSAYYPSGNALPGSGYVFGDRFYVAGSGFYLKGKSKWEKIGG